MSALSLSVLLVLTVYMLKKFLYICYSYTFGHKWSWSNCYWRTRAALQRPELQILFLCRYVLIIAYVSISRRGRNGRDLIASSATIGLLGLTVVCVPVRMRWLVAVDVGGRHSREALVRDDVKRCWVRPLNEMDVGCFLSKTIVYAAFMVQAADFSKSARNCVKLFHWFYV